MSELYRVDLDVFSGPLDLLLYLVRKDEVDIYDIPISHITEQYIHYIEMLKLLDIEVAGDFLIMAATLMEIKSAMLLPKASVEDGEEEEDSDPRAELVRQLLEYKKFKDAANLLESSAEDRSERHTRPDNILTELKQDAEPEVDLEQVSIWDLLEAFDGIMQATGRYADYSSIKDDTPIDLYQIDILHRLQSEGTMSFESIFAGKKNKLVMVGMFLAMLELMRNRLIWVEQSEKQGDIYVRPLTEDAAEEAVQRAIYERTVGEEAAENEQNATVGHADGQPEGAAENASVPAGEGGPGETEEEVNRDMIPIREYSPAQGREEPDEHMVAEGEESGDEEL
ncbi:Segregation and condensation protein A [Anaerohalosphaera lusitana]|uniref:Segregation and condensation protein A n=2 Tax=Anaerohalosphaera lusitana TaxID=1936003 RepID=A0A1U9NM24_9BACT|nr:Segregation and condensation protein A [Anaerohalosphaera lusitana]